MILSVFVQKLSSGLKDFIEEKSEIKFELQITAFSFDRKRFIVALKTNQLAVHCLKKLDLWKTMELSDQCTEIV